MTVRYADLMGADPYPASEPQAVEDDNFDRFMHDEPDYDPSGQTEYRFFYGNGQLHVSPHHTHKDLSNHAGVPGDHRGPMAAGFVTVDGGRATWHVQGNIALSGFSRILKDYAKQVGWSWGGLTDLDGQPIDDSFAPKKSMLLRDNETGDMTEWTAQGRTAWVNQFVDEPLREALREAGYKVAEYPGGSDMNDLMITNPRSNGEDAEMFNNGAPLRKTPEDINPDQQPTGTFKCPECKEIFNDWGQYLLHRKSEEPQREFEEDGHFPQMDMDKVIPPHFHTREPTVMPLASVKEARRVEGFDLYADLWGYNTDDYRHYGAFRNGEIVGYATVREAGNDEAEIIMVQSALLRRGVGRALLRGLQRRYATLYTGGVSDPGIGLMRKCGMVESRKGVWKWAAGQEGKDLIDAPLPLIFDIGADKIYVGHPGTRTSDIPGKFTPGGIVEGEYAPGGKVTITTETNMPWSAAHMLQLWQHSVPHMEVTSLELMDNDGKTTKLAMTRTSAEVGQYVKQVAATYPAAWAAYQALRKAGGKVYVVGGAVRDALMQKEPKDIDLMVSGLPPEVVHNTLDKLPGRMDLTGKNFGVYRYNTRGDEVEVALPRTETSTGDRRVDFAVKVDHNLPVEHDLRRRDFTGNAMAVDLDTGALVDPYGGADAIENRTLSTTHPNSFAEDPTRLLRALVMNARYGWQPDERTRAEMAQHAGRLPNESWDAMRPIMDKLFTAQNPAAAMRLAHETGVLEHIFPELHHAWDFDQHNPHHKYTLGDHSMHVLEGVARQTTDPDLRVAGTLHDVGKASTQVLKCLDCDHTWTKGDRPNYNCPKCGSSNTKGTYHGGYGLGEDHAKVGADLAESRLTHMRWPTARRKRIVHVINHHMFPEIVTAKGARKFLHRVGEDHANDLMTLRQADHGGKGAGIEWEHARAATDAQRALIEQVKSAQAPTSQSALNISGNDLIAMGLKPGPQIGNILRRLTDDVIEDPRLNERNALLERAQEYVAALP